MTTTNLFLDGLFTEDLYQVPPKTRIVITQPWSALTDKDKEQLTKIADALRDLVNPKLRLEAFEIVHEESLDMSKWTDRPDKVIYFGPAIKGLNAYEVIEIPGTRMVLSESLSQLVSDEASRGKLWSALKQLFIG